MNIENLKELVRKHHELTTELHRIESDTDDIENNIASVACDNADCDVVCPILGDQMNKKFNLNHFRYKIEIIHNSRLYQVDYVIIPQVFANMRVGLSYENIRREVYFNDLSRNSRTEVLNVIVYNIEAKFQEMVKSK